MGSRGQHDVGGRNVGGPRGGGEKAINQFCHKLPDNDYSHFY